MCRQYGDESDEEDEIFIDPDNDPDVVRKVYELEGQDMDEDEASEAGDAEAGGGMALRPDGFGEGREEVPYNVLIRDPGHRLT